MQKIMAYFEKMEFSNTSRFDETRVLSDFYLNFGGVGFDASYYRVGELQFMRMPLVGKYMKLEEREQGTAFDPQLLEIFDPVGKQWLHMLQEENVFKGKKHVLSSSDGDVKATRFSIVLTEEQIQQLLFLIADRIEENAQAILANGLFGKSSPEDGHQLIQEVAESIRALQFDDLPVPQTLMAM